MGLNTCRKQWKEQRKQNKIEKSENTQHKLSKDVLHPPNASDYGK